MSSKMCKESGYCLGSTTFVSCGSMHFLLLSRGWLHGLLFDSGSCVGLIEVGDSMLDGQGHIQPCGLIWWPWNTTTMFCAPPPFLNKVVILFVHSGYHLELWVDFYSWHYSLETLFIVTSNHVFCVWEMGVGSFFDNKRLKCLCGVQCKWD